MTLGSLTPEERAAAIAWRKAKVAIRKRRESSRPPMVKKVGQEPRERNNEHLKRIRRLPCLPTLITEGREVYGVDACHVRHSYPVKGWGGNPGMGCKPHDWRTLPMTRAWHRSQHDRHEQEFWQGLGVHPPTVCAELRDCKDFDAMLSVIRKTAQNACVDFQRPDTETTSPI